MENRKLVSMVDYVLAMQLDIIQNGVNFLESHKYANFLRQPLTLSMFVPCSESREVLQEPYFDGTNHQYFEAAMEEYAKAKERCLFEGFEVSGQYVYIPNNEEEEGEWLFYKSNQTGWELDRSDILTIEDLVPYGLTLTKNALI